MQCVFTKTAAASMDRDTVRTSTNPDNLELVFDQVDLTKGIARLIRRFMIKRTGMLLALVNPERLALSISQRFCFYVGVRYDPAQQGI